MKEPCLIWFEVPYKYHPYGTPQRIKNDYFYMMMGEINSHFVRWNKSYEWRQQQIDNLIAEVGEPKRLTLFQKLFT